jgi:hypothetical protein
MISSRRYIITALLVCAFLFSAANLLIPSSSAQRKRETEVKRAPLLTRTTPRRELRRLGYGGTVTLVGAPEGAITIEGWSRSEVDITAEIQVRADTESDLDRVAAVTGFLLDEDVNHLRVLTTGTHDKAYMKSVAKNFPRTLLGLPWKIDYRIRVPIATDLEINAGRGPIKIVGVEGNIRLSATESETSLTLSGGTLTATIATGKVNLSVPVRSWRGGGIEIRIAAGELNVELPPGFNGDVDAVILHTGRIEKSYEALEAREKPGITQQTLKARAGAGGAFFRFTVGVGNIYIRKVVTSDK